MADVASRSVGLTETHGPNRSPIIDRWNRRVGAPLGSPYCASAVSSWLDSSNASIGTRSARSRAFISRDAIPVSHVIRGAYRIRRGDVLVWRRPGGGHIGVAAADWKHIEGPTIEANTGGGSEWNGDGVHRRYRRIQPTATFRITHVIPSK